MMKAVAVTFVVLTVVSFAAPHAFANGFRFGTVFGAVIGVLFAHDRMRQMLRDMRDR
jgi:hypothetical protein